MNRLAHRWIRRPWFAALLLTVFVTRAVMPVGFMLGHGGIMLCPGYAPTIAGAQPHAMPELPGMAMGGMDMAGENGRGHADHAGRHHQGPAHEGMGNCPFAAAAGVIGPAQAPSTFVSSQPVPSAVLLPVALVIPRGTIVPTQLPRGPPAST